MINDDQNVFDARIKGTEQFNGLSNDQMPQCFASGLEDTLTGLKG